MKRKGTLIVAIILMSIGFAAVSTTLIINGSTNIGENTDDYSVIFTKASLDNVDVYDDIVSQDKKTITFKSKDLKKLNDTSVLNYEVTNNSSNYDAEVTINCNTKENTESKYTSIKNELENNVTVVKAKESVNGTLTITLNQTSTEEVTEEYTCTLEFNAIERTELGIYSGPTEWTFDYTGEEQTFEVPVNGTYKLETWGASGGNYSNYTPGYGGFSVGTINFKKSELIYINVGGKGISSTGGYNGGGNTSYNAGGGGGATHIALKQGLLSTLENYKSEILIVSGGGGGSGSFNGYSGGAAGGYIGNNGKGTYNGKGGTQNVGGASPGYSGSTGTAGGKGLFGSGGNGGSESLFSAASGAGGSGFYGGSGGGARDGGGGGGSSYIENPLLTDKSMYCYECTESTEESTKTVSTTCVSEVPTENCAKQGNGYARITLIDY